MRPTTSESPAPMGPQRFGFPRHQQLTTNPRSTKRLVLDGAVLGIDERTSLPRTHIRRCMTKDMAQDLHDTRINLLFAVREDYICSKWYWWPE